MQKELLQQITTKIEGLLEVQDIVVVAVCGGSCTRKTSLVSKFVVDFFEEESLLISQDQFQLQPSYLENIHPEYKWDHPDNFGISACYNALTQLSKNEEVQVPNYSFQKDVPITTKTLKPSRVIVFEGLYANFEVLKEISSLSIYVESMWYERMIRRVFRNTLDRYTNRSVSSVLESFCSSVTRAHQDFVTTQKKDSDIVFLSNLHFQNIITYYNVIPLSKVYSNNTVHFSKKLHQDLFFTIEFDNNTLRYSGKFFYENLCYLEFELPNNLVQLLVEQDWFSL